MPVPDFAQHVAGTYVSAISHKSFTAPPKTTIAAADAKPGDGFSFDDALDIVNPLQHLPIVGTLYRKFTGDQIKPLEKVAGDTLYGGPLGLAGSLADLAFEKITGKNFGDTVYAFVFGDDDKATATASVTEPAPHAATASVTDTPSSASTSASAEATAATPAKVAGAMPMQLPGIPAPGFALDNSSLNALSKSLSVDGIDSDLSERALDAYRRTMAMDGRPAIPPTPIH